MIRNLLRNLLSGRWGFLFGAVCLLGLAFLGNKWQNQIEAAKERKVKEYRVDLDLSQNKAEHLRQYQSFVGSFKLPETKMLRQNEWVQLAQKLAQDQKLSLRELKPVYSTGQKGSKTPDVYLVLEGSVTEVFYLIYKIAQAEDSVYVEKFLLASVPEQTETVRAQITLSQVEGR